FSRESLGVPVVAVGMPTVVDAGLFGGEAASGMFVTPRSIDSLVRAAGRVIGYGVDLALHRGISMEDVDALLG
ncbi:MAG: GPR endopeptidase, partial [Oscillospiraceae bacterium]|nr:GPR endopeptidase [Oscillospiraceae bacterium]